jgi:hypothetical protein
VCGLQEPGFLFYFPSCDGAKHETFFFLICFFFFCVFSSFSFSFFSLGVVCVRVFFFVFFSVFFSLMDCERDEDCNITVAVNRLAYTPFDPPHTYLLLHIVSVRVAVHVWTAVFFFLKEHAGNRRC